MDSRPTLDGLGRFGAFVLARAQVDLGSTNARLGIQED